MQFVKKTWGEYIPNAGNSIQDTIAAAKASSALIESADLQRYEDTLFELSTRIENVVPMKVVGQEARFRGTFEDIPASLPDLQDGDYIFVSEG